MYESFFLISCSKFAIMQVSTADRQEPQAFLSSDKESLFLPDDMDSFLLDFTSYYFIGYRNLPGMIPILWPSFMVSLVCIRFVESKICVLRCWLFTSYNLFR